MGRKTLTQSVCVICSEQFEVCCAGNNQAKQILCDSLAERSVCINVVQFCSRWLHSRCLRAHGRASQQ